MNNSRLTLYFPSWQKERVLCLGRWTKDTNGNLNRLERYIMRANTRDERLSRNWRVLNLLNATIMALNGTKHEHTLTMQQIVGFREAVGADYAALRRKHKLVIPTTKVVRKQWDALEPEIRDLICSDLSKRLKAHDDSPHRTELRWFLNIIMEETHESQ